MFVNNKELINVLVVCKHSERSTLRSDQKKPAASNINQI